MAKLVIVLIAAEYVVEEGNVEKAKEALKRDVSEGTYDFKVVDVPEKYQDVWQPDEL
jgi:hypothetical protein